MTDDSQSRIGDLVAQNDVLLFMKGTPLFPQCGFSSKAVAILEHLGVEFGSVDVLQDMGIRQGIKEFTDAYVRPFELPPLSRKPESFDPAQHLTRCLGRIYPFGGSGCPKRFPESPCRPRGPLGLRVSGAVAPSAPSEVFPVPALPRGRPGCPGQLRQAMSARAIRVNNWIGGAGILAGI